MIRFRILALTALVLGSMFPAQVSVAGVVADKQQDVYEDPAKRFARAQQLKNNDARDAALWELGRLREDFPLDVDYALARARIFAQLGRDAEALDELLVATQLAPDYEAVWKLRFDVLARQQGDDAISNRQVLQQEAAERFPDAQWWHSPLDASANGWTLLVGASRESLSNSQPDWNSEFVELQLNRNAMGQYRIRLARDERFAGADITLGAGAEYSWATNFFAGAEYSAAGSPNFQPDAGYSVHAGKTFADGWVIDLRYRRREYPSASVGSTVVTVERYVSDFRLAYGLGVSRLQGAANLPNHVLTANWFYDEHASIGITVNTGQEAEAIGNGQVLETDVRGVAFSGRRDLGDRFGLQWWLGVHEQGDFYRRCFLGLAVSYRL